MTQTLSPRQGRARTELTTVTEAIAAGRFGPAALKHRVNELREHYARVAPQRAEYIQRNAYYYNQVFRALRFIIPPGKRRHAGRLS